MLDNKMNDKLELDHKHLSYRLPMALLLSAIFFLWAAARPLDVGHDTQNYVNNIHEYFIQDGARYPDVFFNAISIAMANFFDQLPSGREYSGRFFLVLIAFIDSVLLVPILILSLIHI